MLFNYHYLVSSTLFNLSFSNIFDNNVNFNSGLDHNKSAESYPHFEKKLNRIGKIKNRHRRIESEINTIDPFDANRNIVIARGNI